MILFAIFLYATNLISHIILSITYPFLEGSSQGKSVILFAVMGSMLLFYPLFRQDGFIAKNIAKISPHLSFENQKYLKLTIIIIFIAYLFGIFFEIWIRAKFGVSLFTTFVSFGQSASSTSITHSHMLKSMLGSFLELLRVPVPYDVNTGISLAQYFSPVAFVIFITLPLAYLTGLTSLSGRNDIQKVILAFGLTISLIGMLDGGLFSTPALLGLLILLSAYYIKRPFSPKYITKPALIIILLIIIRLSIGIIGTHTDYHEITIIDPKDIDLNGYNVISVQNEENKLIVRVPGDTNDKVLLLKLITNLNGKCAGFFLSWNIYSY